MKMRPKALAGFIILFLFIALIPPVEGNGWPEEQTRHIQVHPPVTGTDADMFVTGAGIGFSSSLVHVLDPNMDIYGYLFFSNIKLNSYFHLENATLRLHTASSMDFDADSSFTIYGINDYRYFGMGDWGYGSPAEIMSAPLTSAYVNYNSSQFYGGQWWDIDVANIVQELKSNPWYEGPGTNFNNPGDYMAFIILGAGGHDTRYFYDASVGNGFEAQLHLHWDFSPPPPSGYSGAVYVEDYENYTIWFNPSDLNQSYVYQWKKLAPHELLFDVLEDSGPILISIMGDSHIDTRARILALTSDETLYATWTNKPGALLKAFVKKSVDRGETWIDATDLGIGPGMDTRNQWSGSIAVDSNDVIHVIFSGAGTGYEFDPQIWYVNYTDSWSMPFRISTGLDQDDAGQYEGSIAVDSEDNLHVVWKGLGMGHAVYHQIFYVNRTSGWSYPLRISNRTNMAGEYQQFPVIAIDNQNNPHVVWTGSAGDFPGPGQVVYTNYTSSDDWRIPMRISNGTGMEASAQKYPSIAINSVDDIEVVWEGFATGDGRPQIYYAVENGTWQIPVVVSNYASMDESPNLQERPSISVDQNDTTHVIWHGTATDYLWKAIWYNHKHSPGSWGATEPIQYTINEYSESPSLMWSMWPGYGAFGSYIITDANGTVLMDNGDPVIFDDIEDAEDWIDIYDPNPEDPDPAGQWSEGPGGATGPFTRFRMRLYLLVLGFGCIFGPVLFFSWRRPTGYYLMAGAIVMVVGLGLLMAIGDI